MKKHYARFYVTFFAIFVFWLMTFYSSGPPAGYTGSPGDGRNCTACHTQTNNYTPTITLTSNIPASGYTPGTTYQLTLNVSSTSNRHGFQMTAEDNGQTRRGTFQSTDSNTQTVGSNQYIEHTSAGTSQTSWTFQWTAPAAGTGTITFYGTVNATNGDNSSGGDSPVTFQEVIQENTTGIDKNFPANIRVYPNPATDFIHISNQDNVQIEGLEIIDLKGRSIGEFPGRSEINISHLPRGQYLLIVKTGKGQGSYHFIKK